MNKKDGNQWDVRLKVWLEINGKPVIGEGRLDMLKAIHVNGSMIQAARDTGVSYRKIRGAIRDMETLLKQPLVHTHRGGGDGGGACLTPAAHSIIETYTDVTKEFQQVAAAAKLQSVSLKNLPPNGRLCHSVSEEGKML